MEDSTPLQLPTCTHPRGTRPTDPNTSPPPPPCSAIPQPLEMLVMVIPMLGDTFSNPVKVVLGQFLAAFSIP